MKAKTQKKKYVDKRNWKEYEKDLLDRKRKIVNFLFVKPTKEDLKRELAAMNRKKRGKQFELPDSLLTLFHFMKNCFRIDDRFLTLKLSRFYSEIMQIQREFDHSAVVKRRQRMTFDIPFDMISEKVHNKIIYADGVCLRVGRGGYYRSKTYKTEVKYVKIIVYADEKGNVIDFTIGDEHDAEVNMLREKLPEIIKGKPKAFNYDGAAASHDLICALTVNGINPIIPASSASINSMANAPPPESCIQEKKTEEKIWEQFVKEQLDYEKWRKETGYSKRWVTTEGKFSVFKRMFGEEILTRNQKVIHDEICIKMMIMQGLLPALWSS